MYNEYITNDCYALFISVRYTEAGMYASTEQLNFYHSRK